MQKDQKRSSNGIQHLREQKRFQLPTESGDAVLDYREWQDKEGRLNIDFTHTYVPTPVRNRGIAGRVVAEGLRYARERGAVIHASCPYVEVFMRRNPDS